MVTDDHDRRGHDRQGAHGTVAVITSATLAPSAPSAADCAGRATRG